MTNAKFCPDCGQRIIRPAGRYPHLDWVPDHEGHTAVSCDVLGQYHARTLKPGEEPRRDEKRYGLHSRTCTAAQAQLPLTDLDDYRRRKIRTTTPAKRRKRRQAT